MPSNEESKKGPSAPPVSTTSPNAKRRRNEPLKTVSSRLRPGTPSGAVSSSTTPVAISRAPMKPRQSLLPPKTASKGPLTLKNEKCKKEIARKMENVARIGNPRSVPQSPTTTIARLPRSGLPTSSSGGATAPAAHPPSNIRKISKPSTSMEIKTSHDEALKLKRLSDAIRGFDVLAIVFCQQNKKYDEEMRALRRQNSKFESHVVALEEKYKELLAVLSADHARQIDSGLSFKILIN